MVTALFTAFVNGTASEPGVNPSHRPERPCV